MVSFSLAISLLIFNLKLIGQFVRLNCKFKIRTSVELSRRRLPACCRRGNHGAWVLLGRLISELRL